MGRAPAGIAKVILIAGMKAIYWYEETISRRGDTFSSLAKDLRSLNVSSCLRWACGLSNIEMACRIYPMVDTSDMILPKNLLPIFILADLLFHLQPDPSANFQFSWWSKK